MGIQCENYHYIFKTGVISYSSSSQQFQKGLFSTIDTNCDLFISNTFILQSLKQEKINLDHCFIPTHQTFTTKQLGYICPNVNIQLFSDLFGIENRLQKLKFILFYYSFLGIRRIAVQYDYKLQQQIIKTFQQINKCLDKIKFKIMIIVPLLHNNNEEQIWNSYITFRKNINHHKELQLVLQFGANLPSKQIIKKWMGQDLRFVSFLNEAFALNNKGFPVLVNTHEKLVKQTMKKHINIFLNYNGPNRVENKEPYFHYFTFILKKVVQNMTDRQIQAQNLIDYLQIPLQPYIDNLDGETYNIFENDGVKYDQYELSFFQAFDQFKSDKILTVYYVGAGKGLILLKLMNAAKKSGKKVKVYCIQKNPYPIQSLKRRIVKNKWSKIVQIVQTDIKEYIMPQKPDIIFSQLLGGIGDNELSPQCVKWAQKNATQTTIIIPYKYTTFIKPVSCHILHTQLSKQQRQMYFTVNFACHYSPFQSKQIWNFQHPLAFDDNLSRMAKIQWQIKQDIILHGFLGSFDCNLYGKAYFSIVPQNKTQNFYSWFPLYFCFIDEEYLHSTESITIEILRNTSQKQVWYTWRYFIYNKQKQLRKQSIWHNNKKNLSLLLTE